MTRVLATLGVAASCLMLFGCQRWGTVEEAEALYYQHKREFHETSELVRSNKALRGITPNSDPYESTKNIWKYAEFSQESKAAYVKAQQWMRRVGLEHIGIHRDGATEVVDFLVFARGIGGDTEGISITHVTGTTSAEARVTANERCKPLADIRWEVCQTR